ISRGPSHFPCASSKIVAGVCDPGHQYLSRFSAVSEVRHNSASRRPARDGPGSSYMTERHLRRLDEIWVTNPIYFITICADGRLRRLANDDFHAIAIEVWRNCEEHYGWSVGRYVIMPDHVHFFAYDSPVECTLSKFVGKWKEWTAKYCRRRLGLMMPLWQPEFFDHVLR